MQPHLVEPFAPVAHVISGHRDICCYPDVTMTRPNSFSLCSDGTNKACPTDAVAAKGTTCRAATGLCDVAEEW